MESLRLDNFIEQLLSLILADVSLNSTSVALSVIYELVLVDDLWISSVTLTFSKLGSRIRKKFSFKVWETIVSEMRLIKGSQDKVQRLIKEKKKFIPRVGPYMKKKFICYLRYLNIFYKRSRLKHQKQNKNEKKFLR